VCVGVCVGHARVGVGWGLANALEALRCLHRSFLNIHADRQPPPTPKITTKKQDQVADSGRRAFEAAARSYSALSGGSRHPHHRDPHHAPVLIGAVFYSPGNGHNRDPTQPSSTTSSATSSIDLSTPLSLSSASLSSLDGGAEQLPMPPLHANATVGGYGGQGLPGPQFRLAAASYGGGAESSLFAAAFAARRDRMLQHAAAATRELAVMVGARAVPRAVVAAAAAAAAAAAGGGGGGEGREDEQQQGEGAAGWKPVNGGDEQAEGCRMETGSAAAHRGYVGKGGEVEEVSEEGAPASGERTASGVVFDGDVVEGGGAVGGAEDEPMTGGEGGEAWPAALEGGGGSGGVEDESVARLHDWVRVREGEDEEGLGMAPRKEL